MKDTLPMPGPSLADPHAWLQRIKRTGSVNGSNKENIQNQIPIKTFQPPEISKKGSINGFKKDNIQNTSPIKTFQPPEISKKRRSQKLPSNRSSRDSASYSVSFDPAISGGSKLHLPEKINEGTRKSERLSVRFSTLIDEGEKSVEGSVNRSPIRRLSRIRPMDSPEVLRESRKNLLPMPQEEEEMIERLHQRGERV